MVQSCRKWNISFFFFFPLGRRKGLWHVKEQRQNLLNEGIFFFFQRSITSPPGLFLMWNVCYENRQTIGVFFPLQQMPPSFSYTMGVCLFEFPYNHAILFCTYTHTESGLKQTGQFCFLRFRVKISQLSSPKLKKKTICRTRFTHLCKPGPEFEGKFSTGTQISN